MMRFLVIAGTVAVLALVAAACTPAAVPPPVSKDAAPPPASQGGPTVAASEQKAAIPSGAAQKPSGPATTQPRDKDAKRGGVLKLANAGGLTNNIAWEESGFTPSMWPQGNTIVQWPEAGEGDHFTNPNLWKVEGDLAKSWEQSPDGLRWIFHLHDGVKWADGTPFTCADAQWSIDTMRLGDKAGLRRSPRAAQFSAISSVECPDSLTLVINMKQTSAAFLNNFATSGTIIYPKHVYQNDFDKLRADPKYPGTGPFTLTEYLPSEKWVFTRKSDYWKQPYPYLDRIEAVVLSTAAIPSALRAGRIHAGQFDAGPADALVNECKDCVFSPRYLTVLALNMTVNIQHPPLNNKDVAQAVAYAIDNVKLTKICYSGWDQPGDGIFHPMSPFALDRQWVKQFPGYDLADPKGNKDKAKAALARAGFKPGDITLNMPVWAQRIEPFTPCITEDLGEIGIKLNTSVHEFGRMYDIIQAGNFDFNLWSSLVTTLDPDAVLYDHFYTGSNRNYGRYSNPEVDRLINLQSMTIDPTERKKLLMQISEIVMGDAYKVFNAWREAIVATRPGVRNYLAGAACGGYGPCARYERVWLDK